MSRNIRQKPSTPVARKTRKGTHTTDGSSDDDYTGVDLISDSEEDEPDVEGLEEQAIIDSEDDDVAHLPLSQPDDDHSSWGGFDLDDGNSVEDFPFFDESMARGAAPDVSAWNTSDTMQGGTSEATPRRASRVTFDVSSSESGHSDAEDEIFPDIFLDQNSLDPTFRRAIENDNDNDDEAASSEDGSYWDFRGEDGNAIVEEAEIVEDGSGSDSSSCGSSGYESGCRADDVMIAHDANRCLQLTRVRRPRKIFRQVPSLSPRGRCFVAHQMHRHLPRHLPPKKTSLSSGALRTACSEVVAHDLAPGCTTQPNLSRSWIVVASA